MHLSSSKRVTIVYLEIFGIVQILIGRISILDAWLDRLITTDQEFDRAA